MIIIPIYTQCTTPEKGKAKEKRKENPNQTEPKAPRQLDKWRKLMQ